MPLSLTIEERVARARADLRIGAPIALTGAAGGALVLAAETLTDARLAALRDLMPETLDLAISHHRAETLRARAYDGALARVIVGPEATSDWIRATVDPSRDLDTPLKGPYATRREGPAALHALGILLAKQARLLPGALVAIWPDPERVREIAAAADFTVLPELMVHRAGAAVAALDPVSAARVPTRFADTGPAL